MFYELGTYDCGNIIICIIIERNLECTVFFEIDEENEEILKYSGGKHEIYKDLRERSHFLLCMDRPFDDEACILRAFGEDFDEEATFITFDGYQRFKVELNFSSKTRKLIHKMGGFQQTVLNYPDYLKCIL